MLFAMRYQPPQQQPALVVMRSANDPASAKIIFDPNSASAKGSVAVDFYVPSFGGKYVAAALSENGSEDAAAHVFEVATGKELSDVVPRVNFATAGGSIAWKADSSGFYYTRYPQGNERPPEDANFYQQVYFHKLGTDPKQDAYVIGKDFPRIAEIQLTTSDDGRWLLASVANGGGLIVDSALGGNPWMKTAAGPRSLTSKTASSPRSLARAANAVVAKVRYTCSRAKMRRAARFSASRSRTPIWRRPKSSCRNPPAARTKAIALPSRTSSPPRAIST
jgi:hypothetical protein